MKITIISGLSGSGKSIALQTLEDLQHYCIDNLPLTFVPMLIERLCAQHWQQPVAIGIDARGFANELSTFAECIDQLRMAQHHVDVVFLQAHDEVLLKRYHDTRRKHPLTRAQLSLPEAIVKERQLLLTVLEQANILIDTSGFNVHQLRETLRFRLQAHHSQLSVQLISFAYRHGLPQDADFVFDARSLPNPHWEPQLKSLTGRDAAVIAFFEAQPTVRQYVEDIENFLKRWLDSFEQGTRSYLTLAIGCSGGQHRSVYIIEQVAAFLQARSTAVLVRHREHPHVAT